MTACSRSRPTCCCGRRPHGRRRARCACARPRARTPATTMRPTCCSATRSSTAASTPTFASTSWRRRTPRQIRRRHRRRRRRRRARTSRRWASCSASSLAPSRRSGRSSRSDLSATTAAGAEAAEAADGETRRRLERAYAQSLVDESPTRLEPGARLHSRHLSRVALDPRRRNCGLLIDRGKSTCSEPEDSASNGQQMELSSCCN